MNLYLLISLRKEKLILRMDKTLNQKDLVLPKETNLTVINYHTRISRHSTTGIFSKGRKR
jgi:hypothetical protein